MVKKVEKATKDFTHGGDRHASDLEPNARFLEYWLGAVQGSAQTLVTVCETIVPAAYNADWEVATGMKVMKRLAVTCVDRIGPYALKYRTDREFGMVTSKELSTRLFPQKKAGEISGSQSYDTLLALQSFYMYLAYIQGHLIALTPAAAAMWDEGFVGAVDFLKTQIQRMVDWTNQQLQSRGPQALLVPHKAAVDAGTRIEENKGISPESRRMVEKAEERDETIQTANAKQAGQQEISSDFDHGIKEEHEG